MMSGDRASAALGIELVSCALGHAILRMKVREDMVNGHGIAHGGLVFALADTAFACACNSFGPVTVSSGAEITYLRPGRAGDVLEAEAVLRARQGRSGLYDVTVRRGTEVVAEFRGHSREVPASFLAREPE